MVSIKSILFNIFVFIVINFIYPIFSNNLKVETLNINIDRLQNDDDHKKQPIKIVQLSDIHYDKIPLRITDKFLEKIVKTTNDLKVDLILITGDLIERDPTPISQLYIKHLSKLKSKYGIYSILGNHDYKDSSAPEIIKNALKNTNINLLENEIVYPMGKSDGGIQLIGMDSYSATKRDKNQMEQFYNEIKSSSTKNLIKLALVHNPDHVIQMLLLQQNENNNNNLNIDIALCGHSHGSQICFPSFNFLGFKIGSGGPVMPHFENLLQKLPFKFIRDIKYPGKKTLKYWQYGKGYHKIMNDTILSLSGEVSCNNNNNNTGSKTKLNLYVNRGLGTHPPIRLFCDPEITVLNIYQ